MGKAIIFDLDGTLLNTLDDLSDSVNSVLLKYGYPIKTKEQIRSYIGNGIRKLVARSIPDGESNNKFELIFTDFKKIYTANCNNKTKPFDGIIELLCELKNRGYKLGIVSNKNDEAVNILKDIYFKNFIDEAVGVCPGIDVKPDPKLVLKILKKLNTSCDFCTYVGDSDVDYYTAKNAGVKCVLVSWGFRDKEQLTKITSNIIDSPKELLTKDI